MEKTLKCSTWIKFSRETENPNRFSPLLRTPIEIPFCLNIKLKYSEQNHATDVLARKQPPFSSIQLYEVINNKLNRCVHIICVYIMYMHNMRRYILCIYIIRACIAVINHALRFHELIMKSRVNWAVLAPIQPYWNMTNKLNCCIYIRTHVYIFVCLIMNTLVVPPIYADIDIYIYTEKVYRYIL